jgi:hypothetical protein
MTLTAMLRQAQHDREHEVKALAILHKIIERKAWPFEKVYKTECIGC